MATEGGEMHVTAEGVKGVVARHFTKVSTATVPAGERWVRHVPWVRQREGLQINPPAPPVRSLGEGMTFDTYDELRRTLARGKSAGPDGIPNEGLRAMPRAFHEGLHRMFQECWRMRRVPQRWKMSHTVLLYKKGDPTRVANYRPIALACTVYKLYTGMITRVLADYAEANGMLSDGQEGFRGERTTARQLRVLTGLIEDSNMRRKDLLVLYVDFVNAFGSVDHKRLFHTLRLLGVPEE